MDRDSTILVLLKKIYRTTITNNQQWNRKIGCLQFSVKIVKFGKNPSLLNKHIIIKCLPSTNFILGISLFHRRMPKLLNY